MKGIGIYIHIPFCIQKCAYCDFLSAPADDVTKKIYMQVLCEEIKNSAAEYEEYEVQTVYFGGGTPSCINESQLAACLSAVKEGFHIADKPEITLELNPGTASAEKLEYLSNIGINRLSIGLQSSDDKELKLLGRIHTQSDFLHTYEFARKAGFKNINVDLISALPGQSLESWCKTLEFTAGLSPEHISAYSLIVEDGTRLAECISQYPALPDEETERNMYYETKRLLSEYGYERYEISNYARKGYESRHNQIYWQRGCNHVSDYAGFGLGASSFVNGCRYKNTDNLTEYICNADKIHKYRSKEILSMPELMEEFMFLGLRRIEGILISEFEKTFGKALYEAYGMIIDKWKKLDCIAENKGYLFLTDKGIDISNMIFADFLLSI